MRKERSLGSAKLAVLESVGYTLGLIRGARTRGKKPSTMGKVYPELQEPLSKIILQCKQLTKELAVDGILFSAPHIRLNTPTWKGSACKSDNSESRTSEE